MKNTGELLAISCVHPDKAVFRLNVSTDYKLDSGNIYSCDECEPFIASEAYGYFIIVHDRHLNKN